MILNRKNIKILNHIHFLSITKKNMVNDKRLIGVIKELNKSSSYEVNSKNIEALIKAELLVIRPFYVTTRVKIKRLVLTDKGLLLVSDRVLYKIENLKEIKKVKSKNFKRLEKVINYEHERNSGFYVGLKLTQNGNKEMCLKCRAINVPCEHGEGYKKKLSVRARPPKKIASKSKWAGFLEEFAPEGLVYL